MPTRISDQPAYLLHRRDWKNNSLILDLLTADFGRISVLAKGGKNSKSRGLFQPFCRLSISWSGRQELKTLTAIDGYAIDIDESQFLSLLYINELLSVFLPLQESNPELFELYSDLLRYFDPLHVDECLREFERTAMALLGYLPDTGVEAHGGSPIEAQLFYHFFASEGFVLCNSNDKNAISGRLVIAWNARQYDSIEVKQLAKTVMRSIIDFNLQGKTLKSRDVVLQIKRHR